MIAETYQCGKGGIALQDGIFNILSKSIERPENALINITTKSFTIMTNSCESFLFEY